MEKQSLPNNNKTELEKEVLKIPIIFKTDNAVISFPDQTIFEKVSTQIVTHFKEIEIFDTVTTSNKDSKGSISHLLTKINDTSQRGKLYLTLNISCVNYLQHVLVSGFM